MFDNLGKQFRRMNMAHSQLVSMLLIRKIDEKN